MKYSCFIVDSQQLFINVLRSIVDKTVDLHCLGSETDEVAALQLLLDKKIRPDVLFLDILMDHINGIDFAERIKHLGIAIVFIASSKEYAFDAFRYGIAYLVKTFEQAEFDAAMDKVRWYFRAGSEELKLEDEMLTLKLGIKGKYLTLPIAQLLCIEGCSNYTKLHLSDGKVCLAYMSIKKLERRLSGLGFFRVHKTFLINLRFIGAIHNKHVTVGNMIIPVSDTYYNHFLAQVIRRTLPG